MVYHVVVISLHMSSLPYYLNQVFFKHLILNMYFIPIKPCISYYILSKFTYFQ